VAQLEGGGKGQEHRRTLPVTIGEGFAAGDNVTLDVGSKVAVGVVAKGGLHGGGGESGSMASDPAAKLATSACTAGLVGGVVRRPGLVQY